MPYFLVCVGDICTVVMTMLWMTLPTIEVEDIEEKT